VPDLTVQLRSKLEIAKGEPRIPQARADYARQLGRINIEGGSQDALEPRSNGSRDLTTCRCLVYDVKTSIPTGHAM